MMLLFICSGIESLHTGFRFCEEVKQFATVFRESGAGGHLAAQIVVESISGVNCSGAQEWQVVVQEFSEPLQAQVGASDM